VGFAACPTRPLPRRPVLYDDRASGDHSVMTDGFAVAEAGVDAEE
jgi:hypothetical protein